MSPTRKGVLAVHLGNAGVNVEIIGSDVVVEVPPEDAPDPMAFRLRILYTVGLTIWMVGKALAPFPFVL